MADFLSVPQRSALMATIRSRGNMRTELVLVALLRAGSISGWRRHAVIRDGNPKSGKRRTVRPDFVFYTARVAVFVDGCFWHGCPRHYRMPRSNRPFWLRKMRCNRKRDRTTDRWIEQRGWKVVRIWEHSLKRPSLVIKKVTRAVLPVLSFPPDARPAAATLAVGARGIPLPRRVEQADIA